MANMYCKNGSFITLNSLKLVIIRFIVRLWSTYMPIKNNNCEYLYLSNREERAKCVLGAPCRY